MSTTKNMPLNWYSSMKKKFRKLRIIFDIENWLWKSEIGIFWSLDLECTLIYPKCFLWKSAIFHSITLPFDAEVAEKFWNVIQSGKINYYLANAKSKEARESGKGKMHQTGHYTLIHFKKNMYSALQWNVLWKSSLTMT